MLRNHSVITIQYHVEITLDHIKGCVNREVATLMLPTRILLFFVFCIFFVNIQCQIHPYARELFNPGNLNDKESKPTFFADPIGLVFDSFKNKLSEIPQGQRWWPEFKKSDTEWDVKQSYKNSEINQPRLDNNLNFIVKNVERDDTPVTHQAPVPSGECSGRGQKVGEIKNVCGRNDCQVTVLRCPPTYSVVDLEDYGNVNITECNVQKITCDGDQVFTFIWAETYLHQLMCNGETVPASEGDLERCSVASVVEDYKLYNFTNAPDESKCWIDFLNCPDYCSNVIVKCNNEVVQCNSTIRCVDNVLVCGFTTIRCNSAPIPCDDPSIACNEFFPDCSNFEVSCNGHNPCSIVQEDNSVITYEPECNYDGLVTCNGELALCNGVVVACADTKKIRCKEVMEPLVSYSPYIYCNDNIEDCVNIIVLCDYEEINCPTGYTWRYNASISDQPFCLENKYLEESDWYDDWYTWYINYIPPSSDAVDDYSPPTHTPGIIPAKSLCRVGDIKFNCTMGDCAERVIECSDGNNPTCPVPIGIGGNYTHWNAFCNGEKLFCTSEPECEIDQYPCGPDDQCSSLVYECAALRHTDCQYSRKYCYDACWVRDGDWNCICPLDFMGEDCEAYRPFLCNITLVDPLPSCIPYPDKKLNKIESDPICFQFSVFQTVTFTYSINCFFTNLTDIEKSDDERVHFDYYVRRDYEFARSSFQDIPKILLKIFNFNRLSEMSAATAHYLTPNQLAFNDSIFFDMNFGNLLKNKNKYFHGGRVYFEVDLYRDAYNKVPRGLEKRQTDRRFIDFIDYVPDAIDTVPSFAMVLISTFADPSLIITVCIAGFAVYYFVKLHQKYERVMEHGVRVKGIKTD